MPPDRITEVASTEITDEEWDELFDKRAVLGRGCLRVPSETPLFPLSCFHDELRTRVRTPLREQVWQFEVADTRIQCHINPPIETLRGEVVRPVIADIQ